MDVKNIGEGTSEVPEVLFVVYLRLKITFHKSKWIKLLHTQKETREKLQRTDLPEYSKT